MSGAPLTPTKPLLHLGVGATGRPGPGWLQCDLYPGPGIDVAFDLMQPWPFDAGSVQGIYSSHVLEHLPDPMFFFREAYRVLEDRCLMRLRVPYGGHRMAWCDITHVRPWYAESFAFLQPGYAATIHNPQHDAWDAPFVVDQVGCRVARKMRRLLRLPGVRRRWLARLALWPEAIEELWVQMFPVKDPQAQAYWRQARNANAVPVRYLMYAHDWAGMPWHDGDPLTLVDLSTPRVTPAGI